MLIIYSAAMTYANSTFDLDAAGWSRQRVLAVLAVIALHLGLLALFMAAPRSSPPLAVSPAPLELLYMPTATLPKHKAENSDLPRAKSPTAISIILPSVDFPTLPSTASDSPGHADSAGMGAGIDWAAEARRELQANQIRQNAPPSENHMAGRSSEDRWWPRAAHQKGDQYKTDTGDWVVWINSNCYQVATAMPRSFGQGPAMPQTYCPSDSHSPRGDLFKDIAEKPPSLLP